MTHLAVSRKIVARCAFVALLSFVATESMVWAQPRTASGASIYTCVDKNGRRITSDRPIPECLDREQRELTGTGTLKRVVPPSYTAEERARMEAQRKAEEEERARVTEERRRERALVMRFPNAAAHAKARADALLQVEELTALITRRIAALREDRKAIDVELEFYKGDVAKAPMWLQRKVADNEQQLESQQRFLAERAQEKQRINERFDEELERLQQLWARN